ncbi:hypothetical protein CDD82_1418 [Ophiocordyceps australis]|uniref:Glycosyltransferase 2-like domain-containing protein n=1 Tax=Ophiocordyceps australis TaxID=1399860 RepID=A0A2C5YKP8_9HYPO|nr:hypothetical protein CDD82_1418 [Ophiocordyceps australis]
MRPYPDHAEHDEKLDPAAYQGRNQPSPEQQFSGLSRPARANVRYPPANSPYSSPYSHNDGFSPEWPPSVAGRSDSQTLYESNPYDSRSSLRSWRTDQHTPVDMGASPRFMPSFADSSPSMTPMNQSTISLAALLPHQHSKTHPAREEFVDLNDSVAILDNRDDVDIWHGWKRYLFKLVPFLTFANTAVYLAYLALRIACVIWSQQQQGQVFIAAWIFIAVEIAVAIPSLMHNSWTMWSMKSRNRQKFRLKGYAVPTVDVFITCCGEDDDLVIDTVRAACDLDYPYDRFRVVILDDAKSEGLSAAASRLAMQYPNIYYMAREKIPGKPHHFKAGNLNYGLDQVHLLPGGAGQFMAALDADMIPERDWLRAVLPHLLVDPKMALACPPQLFYNTPTSDPLAQSLDFFVHVIEPIKDALGVAWCTGSGYVVRREALEEIGNFPLGSLAEDVATSTLMLGRGWKTAYVHEPLQFGTVPDDYGSHLKQRTRWAIGTVDTSFKLNFCLWGEKVREMNFAQRFSGFMYAMLSIYTIPLVISMFAIPIILVMRKPLVAYANDDQLRWLIWAAFAATMTNRLCEYVMSIPAGFNTGQRSSRYQLWMSPYIAICILRSFVLPKWLGGQVQAFKPTGSLASALNERDPVLKKNMLGRLRGILFSYMGIFHLFFVYFTLVGVTLTSFGCFMTEKGVRELLICLVTHAFWPPLTFIFLCSSLWIPVAYAIDPPMMPEREQLLDRDPKTLVAHPTAKSKKIAFGGQAAWLNLELIVSTGFTILIFVASFIV